LWVNLDIYIAAGSLGKSKTHNYGFMLFWGL